MRREKAAQHTLTPRWATRATAVAVALALLTPFNIFSASLCRPDELPDSLAAPPAPAALPDSAPPAPTALPDSVPPVPEQECLSLPGAPAPAEAPPEAPAADSAAVSDMARLVAAQAAQADSLAMAFDPDYVVRDFNPDPKRAVWLSALFPGLGQLYNRRYWKLPLVVGGFMGLAYGMSWNNQMLTDYTQGYRDLMDNDPDTRSYMDFYPPNTDEARLNKSWLQKTFKARKDYFRRNRDLCIISMIGLYMVAMVDAYVDASLTHFDISSDLSVDFSPTVIPDQRGARPGFGVLWAVSF